MAKRKSKKSFNFVNINYIKWNNVAYKVLIFFANKP